MAVVKVAWKWRVSEFRVLMFGEHGLTVDNVGEMGFSVIGPTNVIRS